MLKRGKVQRRDCCPNIFNGKGCFGGNTVGGKIIVYRSSQKSPIYEEFKGNWSGRFKEGVDKCRERIATQICYIVISDRSRTFLLSREGFYILVLTRIGPVLSGSETSASRVVRSNFTWVVEEDD